MNPEQISLRKAAAVMMQELRRLRDTNHGAWDALVDPGLCNAWDGLKGALGAADPVLAALDQLTLGFKMEPEKLDRHWSFGYWEGYDAGLVLVNGGEAPFLQNSRFRAVIRYEPTDIKAALAAVKLANEEKKEAKFA